MKRSKIAVAVMAALSGYAARTGLALGALDLEVDKLDTVPEFQRGWYEEDKVTKKFKLNPAKVEVEDVSGLKSSLASERDANRKAKAAQDKAVREALSAYDGIDPVKARAIMAQFEDADEAALMTQGKEGLEKILARRNKKRDEEVQKQIEEASQREGGAMELAQSLMEDAVDNKVRAACTAAGVHPGAVEDALLRARSLFSLDDDKNVVQYEGEDDEQTIVLGKDGKTPFSPTEWLEDMKTKAPHWFPAGASGGGALGNKDGKGRIDMTGLSPTARLTAARAAQGAPAGRK